ncbi:MAG: hypothetical protein M1822_008811 [Bathelium mastoideum]|nr:MAG: hypothetical protein M1822_008811 [Bathelium mastoideum]
MNLAGIVTMLVQLVVAAIPFILHQDWAILLITGVGSILAITMGMLPQWRAERLPTRQKSGKNIALTSGNGARDIMVILGAHECLDLEELSAAESPRSPRPWEKFVNPSGGSNTSDSLNIENGVQCMPTAGLWSKSPSMCWLLLLITVGGLEADTWYLLAVGAIGMFQNAIIAAIDRSPETRDVPLRFLECILTKKVMDGLMDLEDAYSEHGSFGGHLLHEFFPGKLREDEKSWWNGDRKKYETARMKEKENRGLPRGIEEAHDNRTGWDELVQDVSENDALKQSMGNAARLRS